MRSKSAIYAAACTLLLLGFYAVVFFFAYSSVHATQNIIKAVVGMALGLFLAPAVHELGHVYFAKTQNMRIEYVKFFCFKWIRKQGKLRFAFASPFTAEQTQVIPKKGGNMQKRAGKYTLGGLAFSGALINALAVYLLISGCFFDVSYFALGVIPYVLYLFLLNVLPVEYASGKTDMFVYIGMKKGYDAEKVMLSAMEIQGRIFAGESFAEMDEKLYFDLPVLCEDEPLFLVITDLRYRLYLERGDVENAGKELNRLASLEEYMTVEEKIKTAIELAYMHALTGDRENALQNAQFCKAYLGEDRLESKRALIALALAVGKKEDAEKLINDAEKLLENEKNLGIKKFESILLSRMKNA